MSRLVERLLKKHGLDGIRIVFFLDPFSSSKIKLMAVKDKDKATMWQTRFDIRCGAETDEMLCSIWEDLVGSCLDRMAVYRIIDFTQKMWKDPHFANARDAILDIVENRLLEESAAGRAISLVDQFGDNVLFDRAVYEFIAPFSTRESLSIGLDLEERADVAIQERQCHS